MPGKQHSGKQNLQVIENIEMTIRVFAQQFEVECLGGSGCPLLRRTDKSPRSRRAVSYRA